MNPTKPRYSGKTTKGRHGNSKYPWADWFGGQGEFAAPFLLQKGVHYTCDTTTFRQIIRSRALKEGKRVSIHLEHDDVVKVTVYHY